MTDLFIARNYLDMVEQVDSFPESKKHIIASRQEIMQARC